MSRDVHPAIGAGIGAVLVGACRPLAGTPHASAIAKRPAPARLWLGALGFAGDEQADRRHHGGADKAVHHYAFDHYAWWSTQIGARDVFAQPGAFGENLSTSGMTERDVCIGDVFTLGGAVLQLSQSRQPCWKLNARFEHPRMAALVQQSGRTGWYYRVLKEGWVEPGAVLALHARPHPEWPLSAVLDVLYRRTLDTAALDALCGIETLPPGWRKMLERRRTERTVEDWTKRLEG
ncbi:MOSC domain-containing protein [Burkholderia stagnalis]|uniref:MOSC domain-containing protein n=1 Tax=Burkholderia stagnalis TaxID=1503054 RepID=UPI000F574D94|nr:MOSC domain-containing protein [Burkholderia stagnalis]RQQ22904.1 MOSC domain-containing protein [Burkholderia stagnalis]RQQ31252.1 MOSC domain-containing protein [Burkholderia stagnalis]RQQ47697.1 MOSC domain-containing protein [Burkholderia stagnalis]RQX90860.1 MOSC domain-containing protein [Burkholderia stagnalis]RQY14653.1 MOSC domain-containing protein [Burkholderia stagnalis]